MAIVSTAAAVASTAGQVYLAERRQDAMEAQLEARQEAAERQRRMAALKNAAQRRRAVAQRRIQIGEMRNAAAAAGATGSSGAIGGQVSLLADAVGDIGTSDQLVGLNRERLGFLSSAASAGAEASRLGTLSNIVGAVTERAASAASSFDFTDPATTSAVTNTAPTFQNAGTAFALPNRSSITAQRIR